MDDMKPITFYTCLSLILIFVVVVLGLVYQANQDAAYPIELTCDGKQVLVGQARNSYVSGKSGVYHIGGTTYTPMPGQICGIYKMQ